MAMRRRLWASRSTLLRCSAARRSFAQSSLSLSSQEERLSDTVTRLSEIVGPTSVVTDADDLVNYNRDWLHKYTGQSRLAVLPQTTEQVSAILKYCNEQRLHVVPQGGNTGLVGGSVPLNDEIVLSLRKMDHIESLDETSGVLVCQAGCILENVNNWLAPKGFMMPWDLGAKGSCHVGGNISTNAGGLRVVRYGSLRGSILGLEAVLADGRLLDLMSVCRKDNTGYDLKQLFIGSEGTLGVVTRCAVAVARKPAAVNVALLALDSFDAVLAAQKIAKERLGEVLSAMELMDSASFDAGVNAAASGQPPLAAGRPFYLLLETSGSDAAHDAEKLERFVEAAAEAGAVADGVVAQSEGQAASLWAVREHVPVASAALGPNLKYDVSLPLSCFYELVEAVKERVESHPAAVFGYGHLGDGNLHVNVAVPVPVDPAAAAPAMAWAAARAPATTEDVTPLKAVLQSLEHQLQPFVFDWVVARGGSISAEHGIGRFKRRYLPLQKPAPVLGTMADLKRLLDPHGILNPGKVIA